MGACCDCVSSVVDLSNAVMKRRQFFGMTAGAIGASCGECCAVEREFPLLLGLSPQTAERRYFHFTFEQTIPDNSVPKLLARNPRASLSRLIRAESVQWESESAVKLESLDILTLSGLGVEDVKPMTAKEFKLQLSRRTMKAGTFNGLPYESCILGADADNSVHHVVAFEKPVALPIMLIDRSKNGEAAYIAQQATVLSETGHTVRLSGLVLSCGLERISITDSVDVILASGGLAITYDTAGMPQTITQADAKELISQIKSSK